ncbi:uncharacterized protein [Setaria viridis]|uniref:uncharacterized protein isoform X2 n=1 Tax=Setaria viridis TaxID=4556 RepID=UPI0014932A14|nr:uncharacterized protein LOC117849887 isoform X2 [Setaria viridis]
MATPGGAGDSWEYSLRKYLLLLASLVATVTYGAAFNPPGGVWQDDDPAKGRIAGDPIIQQTNHPRYLVFFYGNATAFASSLVVIVLILILSILHDRGGISLAPVLAILRLVMVLDLLSLMVAYAAGTFRDVFTAVYSLLLLAGVVAYLLLHLAPGKGEDESPEHAGESEAERADKSALLRLRKVLMLLATFAVSVTYVAGLSAPGGFWDNDDGGQRPGRAILKGGRHDARLKAFFVFNTTAFVASLLIIIILLDKKLTFSKNLRSVELYVFIAVTLIGLVGAYSAGSCRQIDTTIYVNSLCQDVCVAQNNLVWSRTLNDSQTLAIRMADGFFFLGDVVSAKQQEHQVLEKARSLVLLLSTLAAAITYQAGLNPPGGLWQDDDAGGRYKNGDPILLTVNPRRYKAFYYCNSIAFVASLVAIILARTNALHHHNALEAAMILDLFGLIGAYAAGSCRDVSTSIYAMALAGAVLVYVVIHVVFLTLGNKDGSTKGNDEASLEKEKRAEELMEKRRKRLLLFAILAATITYQAGLTPPGGFLDNDDQVRKRLAGDPVLLNNDPRRYTAFFYCNSVSFMLSIALIILLVNPNLYRPAIRSNALSVCTAAGLIGIMGGYAAGCTQHLKTSIYIFVLAAVVLGSVVLLVAVFFVKNLIKQGEDKPSNSSHIASLPSAEEGGGANNATRAEQAPSQVRGNSSNTAAQVRREKKLHAKRKYLMLLGILAASVTYQAGLAPPGGFWQSNGSGHAAGDPVMHDNRRSRYLAFFYSNSTSFVASVVVIVLLLPPSLQNKPLWLWVMNATIVLDLLGLLIAYAAGSSRTLGTSMIVSTLVFGVLVYFAIHVLLSHFSRRRKTAPAASASGAEPNEEANGGLQAQMAPGHERS